MNLNSAYGWRGYRLRALIALAAIALVAGCSSGTDGGTGEAGGKEEMASYQEGISGETGEGESPQQGGKFTFAAYSEPASLDPAVTIAAGQTGGSAMGAIYDTLIRYDAGTQEFTPQLAAGIEANDKFDVWTLKLRPGVTFTNGTEVDSAAVKASQQRYAEMRGPESALWTRMVAKIETPDAETVVYRLHDPWTDFPSMLSTGPGMIVAPEVGAGPKFTPIGAGPFVFERHRPKEEILLSANPDYWGDGPYVDQLQFVFLGSQDAALDSLKGGQISATVLRDPDKVDLARDAGIPGYMNLVALSNIVLINGQQGHPGEDPRVRKAMQMAIDPSVAQQRAYAGHGIASSTVFEDYSRWHTEETGLPYDPDAAKALLKEAMADGFDGKIGYLDSNDPASRNTALAVKASLEAVGFTVKVDLLPSVLDLMSKVLVENDYDLASWGINLRESDPYSQMFSTLSSEGTQLYGKPTSPEMDEAIEAFRAATDEESQMAAMEHFQTVYNELVPVLLLGPFAEYVAWDEGVRGVKGNSSTMILFDGIWLS